MNKTNNILKVNIFGTEYPLKVSADVEYVKSVAKYVDSKMIKVQEAKPSRPLHQIAILAALNICDELFQKNEIDDSELNDFKERIERMNERIELGLKQTME
jgi:cell division protein ZapA